MEDFISSSSSCSPASIMDDPMFGGGLSLEDMIDGDMRDFGDGESDFSSASSSAASSLSSSSSSSTWTTRSALNDEANNTLEDYLSSPDALMVNPNSVMPVNPVHVHQPPVQPVLHAPATTRTVTSFSLSNASSPAALNSPIKLVHTSSTATQAATVASPLKTALSSSASLKSTTKKSSKASTNEKENCNNGGFPKPAYSYSCLIALALKNSRSGYMSVSEIYRFMCEHFPYFKTAPTGWKNSVRHNLSLNKCFEKIEKPAPVGSNQRKGCLWAMNPAKIAKMDEEVLKWSRKDASAIKRGMSAPNTLESLERGEMVKDYSSGNGNHTKRQTPTTTTTSNATTSDPMTPTSLSSSQGYDSAGSDFIDIEGVVTASLNASSSPSEEELSLQANNSSANFMVKRQSAAIFSM